MTRRLPRLSRLPHPQHVAKTADGSVLCPGNKTSPIHDKPEKPLDIETRLAWDVIMADSQLLDTDMDLAQSVMGQDAYSVYGNSNPLFIDPFQTLDAATPASNIAPEVFTPSSLAHRATASDSSEIASASPKPTSSPGHENCLSSKMLEVYETAIVGLSRTPRTKSIDPSACIMRPILSPPPGPNDELTCQKEVLRSCERWLSKDASRIQSQHAMLMVSIFDSLLTSILSMAETSRDGLSGNAPISPVSPSSPSSYAGGRKWSIQDANYTFQADQWKDDEEERIHVLKSLLNLRASRIKGLLERLGAIAASNQWQMQTTMVQNLLDRLTKPGDLF